MARHQKRVMRRLAARMARKRTPRKRPWAKCGWRKSRTRYLKNGVDDFAGGFDGGDVAVLERREDGADSEVEGGQNRQAEGADQQAEGIEPADGGGTEAGGDQAGDQDDIFDGLPALVAVGIDALLAALGFGRQVADEVLKGAHGADPAAEEAAQKERGQQDEQAPEQAAIEGVAGQGIDEGDQRVPLEEEAHRGGS